MISWKQIKACLHPQQQIATLSGTPEIETKFTQAFLINYLCKLNRLFCLFLIWSSTPNWLYYFSSISPRIVCEESLSLLFSFSNLLFTSAVFRYRYANFFFVKWTKKNRKQILTIILSVFILKTISDGLSTLSKLQLFDKWMKQILLQKNCDILFIIISISIHIAYLAFH